MHCLRMQFQNLIKITLLQNSFSTVGALAMQIKKLSKLRK